MFDGWLKDGFAAMGDVPGMIFDPGERLFWPSLLAALIIAVVLSVRRSTARQELTVSRQKAIWLHRTALVDYQLILAKAFIEAALFAPLVVSTLVVAAWVIELLTSSFGTPTPNDWSRLQVALLYTAVLFVVSDFSRFFLHLLAHRVPFLWSFHQVHHSAVAMTPFTVSRSHPVESLLFALRGTLSAGLVTGVFFYFFRDRAIQIDLLGVNALGFVFNLTGANLRHSHVWLSYGPKIERYIISPAQHQIHHSNVRPIYHLNLGSCLAIWDRMFGTLVLAKKERDFEFGLPDDDRNHNPENLLSCLVLPMVDSARRLAAYVPALGRRLAPAGMLLFIATLAGCSCRSPASGSQGAASSVAEIGASASLERGEHERLFAELARDAPEFAGFYFADANRLVVLVKAGTDASRAAAVGDAVRERTSARIASTASASPAELELRRTAQFGFSELAAWRDAMLPALRTDGVAMLAVDERRNRVVVRIRDDSARAGVDTLIRASSVPRSVVLIERDDAPPVTTHAHRYRHGAQDEAQTILPGAPTIAIPGESDLKHL
jgi:sterol desaturase/sphingolipid hydroxylase (fatty acid hydroxylase superfamily)